jgi:hypothetical protein
MEIIEGNNYLTRKWSDFSDDEKSYLIARKVDISRKQIYGTIVYVVRTMPDAISGPQKEAIKIYHVTIGNDVENDM